MTVSGVFDARAMPAAEAYGRTSTWREPATTAANVLSRGWEPPPSLLEHSLPLFEGERAAAGIAITGLPARIDNGIWGGASNDDVRALAQRSPTSRIWYAAVDHRRPAGGVDEARSRGARAIVVEPYLSDPAVHVDDMAVDHVYGEAQDLGVPVMVMLGGEYGVDLGWCDPVRVERVATRFPRLDIVVVHAAWPLIDAMLGVAYRCPRVWLLPDVYFPRLPGEQSLVRAISTFLRGRVLYGSGYPFCPMGQHLEAVRRLDLAEDVLDDFLLHNALRLLGPTPDATTKEPRA